MIENPIPFEIPPEVLGNWQDMLNVLAELVHIPAALIMRITPPHIEVFLSSRSPDNPYPPGEKQLLLDSGLYCETVIRTQAPLLVPDALSDACWKNNPDVKLNMISYLGFPLRMPDKSLFGTLCILDRKPNSYSKTIEKLMLHFRDLIEAHLGLIHVNSVLGDTNKRLSDYLLELQALRGLVCICSSCKSIKDKEGCWRPIEQYLIRHPEADFSHGICPECMKKLYAGES